MPEEPGVLVVPFAPPIPDVARPPIPAVADSRVFISFEPPVPEAPPGIEAVSADPVIAPDPVMESPPEEVPLPVDSASAPAESVDPVEVESPGSLAAIDVPAPNSEAQAVDTASEAPVASTTASDQPAVTPEPSGEDRSEAWEAVELPQELLLEATVVEAAEPAVFEPPPPAVPVSDTHAAAEIPEVEVEADPVEAAAAAPEPLENTPAAPAAIDDAAETSAVEAEPVLEAAPDLLEVAAAEIPWSEAGPEPVDAAAAAPEPLEDTPAASAAAAPAEIVTEAVASSSLEAVPPSEEAILADPPPSGDQPAERLAGKAAAATAGVGPSVAPAPVAQRVIEAPVTPTAPSVRPTRGKRPPTSNTSVHRSEHGAPCPVCSGSAWMRVSPTLERCPRCSVLRLDPGSELVQPMETQDLVLLRRVEAFRRESRDRVLAVMNASHVSTGDLAELSLTPEQLAEMRADGRPHIFGSFGMCVLPFALEQSRQPVELLRSVHDMLVPGGRLLVASFDPLSLRSLMFGARWSGLRLPGQVYSFRRQHVERMLREAGFEKPRVERVSGCLRAAKPAQESGSKFEMLALWRTIQNWGAASMFDAAKA